MVNLDPTPLMEKVRQIRESRIKKDFYYKQPTAYDKAKKEFSTFKEIKSGSNTILKAPEQEYYRYFWFPKPSASTKDVYSPRVLTFDSEGNLISDIEYDLGGHTALNGNSRTSQVYEKKVLMYEGGQLKSGYENRFLEQAGQSAVQKIKDITPEQVTEYQPSNYIGTMPDSSPQDKDVSADNKSIQERMKKEGMYDPKDSNKVNYYIDTTTGNITYRYNNGTAPNQNYQAISKEQYSYLGSNPSERTRIVESLAAGKRVQDALITKQSQQEQRQAEMQRIQDIFKFKQDTVDFFKDKGYFNEQKPNKEIDSGPGNAFPKTISSADNQPSKLRQLYTNIKTKFLGIKQSGPVKDVKEQFQQAYSAVPNTAAATGLTALGLGISISNSIKQSIDKVVSIVLPKDNFVQKGYTDETEEQKKISELNKKISTSQSNIYQLSAEQQEKEKALFKSFQEGDIEGYNSKVDQYNSYNDKIQTEVKKQKQETITVLEALKEAAPTQEKADIIQNEINQIEEKSEIKIQPKQKLPDKKEINIENLPPELRRFANAVSAVKSTTEKVSNLGQRIQYEIGPKDVSLAVSGGTAAKFVYDVYTNPMYLTGTTAVLSLGATTVLTKGEAFKDTLIEGLSNPLQTATNLAAVSIAPTVVKTTGSYAKNVVKNVQDRVQIYKLNKQFKNQLITRDTTELLKLSQERMPGLELQVRPVESIIGRSAEVSTPTVTIGEAQIKVRLGEPELVRPDQMANPNVVVIKGQQITNIVKGKAQPGKTKLPATNRAVSTNRELTTSGREAVIRSEINKVGKASDFYELLAENRALLNVLDDTFQFSQVKTGPDSIQMTTKYVGPSQGTGGVQQFFEAKVEAFEGIDISSTGQRGAAGAKKLGYSTKEIPQKPVELPGGYPMLPGKDLRITNAETGVATQLFVYDKAMVRNPAFEILTPKFRGSTVISIAGRDVGEFVKQYSKVKQKEREAEAFGLLKGEVLSGKIDLTTQVPSKIRKEFIDRKKVEAGDITPKNIFSDTIIQDVQAFEKQQKEMLAARQQSIIKENAQKILSGELKLTLETNREVRKEFRRQALRQQAGNIGSFDKFLQTKIANTEPTSVAKKRKQEEEKLEQDILQRQNINKILSGELDLTSQTSSKLRKDVRKAIKQRGLAGEIKPAGIFSDTLGPYESDKIKSERANEQAVEELLTGKLQLTPDSSAKLRKKFRKGIKEGRYEPPKPKIRYVFLGEQPEKKETESKTKKDGPDDRIEVGDSGLISQVILEQPKEEVKKPKVKKKSKTKEKQYTSSSNPEMGIGAQSTNEEYFNYDIGEYVPPVNEQFQDNRFRTRERLQPSTDIGPDIKIKPKFDVGMSPNTRNIVAIDSKTGNRYSLAQTPRSESVSIIKVQQRQEQRQQQSQRQEQAQRQEIKSAQLPDQIIKSMQDTAQATDTAQRTRQTQISRNVFDFNTPKPEPPFKPKPPIKPPKFDLISKGNKQKKLYRTLVRRSGQFKEIGISETPQEAIKKGRKRVEETAAASFKVEEIGNPLSNIDEIGNNILPKDTYYQSKKDSNVFIQRAKKRISSPGEKMDITYKGIAATRNRSVKKKKKSIFDIFTR